MKLVLLQPPIQDFYETPIRLQPLGLAYLKAAVKHHLPDVEVVIRDFHHGWGRRTIALPAELRYVRAYYAHPDQSPFSTFFHYYHFGASFETVAEVVAQDSPDLVGISALFSPYYREALRCAEVIKRRLPVPVVMGGSHVSALPHYALQHRAVDFVICGEGERPLVEFLKTWRGDKNFAQVPNLGFKQDGRCVINRRDKPFFLDSLPLPDFTDLALEKYRYQGKPLCFVLTSRGCPNRCSFCCVHETFGRRYRRRSNEGIMEEITVRYRQGYRVFDFEDDNLTADRKKTKDLCRRLAAAFPPGEVQFLAMNGICYHTLDDELLALLKKAGFTHLNLAPVSSDPVTHEVTNRPGDMGHYQDMVNEAVRIGFAVVSYQILGLPHERLDSMVATLVLGARLPVLLGASPFYCCPGSPISRRFPEPSEEDLVRCRLAALGMDLENCRREELYTLFVTTRIINFLKGIVFDSPEQSLADVLATAATRGGRQRLGAVLLQRLLCEGKLYAAGAKGFHPLPHFRVELFFALWNSLDYIKTQHDRVINAVHETSSMSPVVLPLI